MRSSLFVVPVVLAVAAIAYAETDPLAELASLGEAMAETTPEGGGSIRAKKEVDTTRQKRLKDPRNLEGKVESIKTGAFPAVAIKVRIAKPAKDGPGKSVKSGDAIVVVPKLKIDAGKVDLADADTRLNAGSFYLQGGDRVVIRLGAAKGAVFEAEYIERK